MNQNGQFVLKVLAEGNKPMTTEDIVQSIAHAIEIKATDDLYHLVDDTLLGGLKHGFVQIVDEYYYIPNISAIDTIPKPTTLEIPPRTHLGRNRKRKARPVEDEDVQPKKISKKELKKKRNRAFDLFRKLDEGTINVNKIDWPSYDLENCDIDFDGESDEEDEAEEIDDEEEAVDEEMPEFNINNIIGGEEGFEGESNYECGCGYCGCYDDDDDDDCDHEFEHEFEYYHDPLYEDDPEYYDGYEKVQNTPNTLKRAQSKNQKPKKKAKAPKTAKPKKAKRMTKKNAGQAI